MSTVVVNELPDPLVGRIIDGKYRILAPLGEGGMAQVYLVGILPQVMPVLIGTTVYRWDINVRESSVLGFVGAGGIGLQLYASINSFTWAQVVVVLFAILVVVLASEAFSAWVRARIS